MILIIILSFYLKSAYTDYIYVLNPEEPFLLEEFSILEEKNEEGIVYRWSAWFQYLPLSSSTKAQTIGINDSNCYHLFSSVDQKSKSLNFLHYDCQNPIEMKIQKIIKFIGNDGLQYSFEMNINNFEYENQWYYFDFIYFLYNKKFQIIFIKNEQIIQDEILNILPFEDINLLQKIGGDLMVEDSKIINIRKGDKFASFPGKIMPIYNDNNIKNFALAAISLSKSRKACKCQSNPVKTLMDSDFYELKTLIYTSKFSNCNSFIFSGWFKINEIIKIDQEMTFQFIKLSSNMQNNQLQNQNLSPLQLFYKLSQDINKVVLTTYSYTFPSVTQDFTNDPFLIIKEFNINNNISLWHLLYVRLIEDNLKIIIKFYEKQQVYEYNVQIVVKQFHQIYYKLFLGNFQQQQTNYLNMIGRNLQFINCNENFQQKNCHISCGDCDGPTYQDCLSCSEESHRIYISEYKQCICPYNKIDSEDKCKDYEDFNFKLISKVEQNEDCLYGQFELNGICFQCPGQINSETKACFECLLNQKDWQKNPICQTDLFLKKDGTTTELQNSFQLKQYYIFNGMNLELCSECQEQSLTDENNINLDFVFKVQSFKQFCINETPSDQCYRCINNCLTCAVLMTGEVCLTCYFFGEVQNGHCIYPIMGKQEKNNCLSPYYVTYSKECKRCTIDYCIYCFDYVQDDLTISTLYKNFQQFSGDENLKVGCAMCQDEYIFDFRIGLCIKQSSNIETCIRSYINQEGIEKCTLSSKQDFSISREISNCETLISNCLQCFLTVQSILKCIICKEGYTSSTSEVNGQCFISKKPYSIISIEGNSNLKDAWVERIQSFMGSFLPNQYFYPISQSSYLIDEIAITCQEGYQLALMKYCVQYCNSNCLQCQLNHFGQEYFCNRCPLDYFKEPQRVQENGTCLKCSPLCAYCQTRSTDEITQAQYYFITTEDNLLFTKKCYAPAKDPNIIISSHQFVPIYCLDKYCQNQLLYEYDNQNCQHEEFLFDSLLNNVNLNYFNQIGIQKITIQLNYPKGNTIQCTSAFRINSIQLKQNIFSLKTTDLIINGNYIIFGKTDYQYLIQNFDSIEISNISMQFLNQSIQLQGNTKLKFLMKNIQFLGKHLFQINQFLNSKLFDSIELINITMSNVIFSESSFLFLDSLKFKGYLQIETLTILNSTFLNSNLFKIINSKVSIYIYNLQIENCIFINSSILSIQQNLSLINISEISSINVKNCKLTQSQLLYFIGQVKLNIKNLFIFGNSLYNSSFLTFSYNTSIIDAKIEHNYLEISNFIQTHVINITEYFQFTVYNLIVENLSSQNSNLFQLSSNSYFNNLIIEFSNLYLENIIKLNSFNYQHYIFTISHSFKCIIQQTQIINARNLAAFYFFESDKILIENLKITQNLEKKQVDFSSSCRQLYYLQNQLLRIEGFIQFKLRQVEINNYELIDSSIIELTSTLRSQANIQENIDITDIIFKQNLIQKNEQGMSSLISMYSEKKQFIKINNISFINNFYHQYQDDPNDNFAGLIYIHSMQGEIQIDNIYCQENAITNSSASFFYFISQSISLNNFVIKYHNIIKQQLWSQFYNLKINEQYNQDQINQIIQQIYPIYVKGGAAKIFSQNFQCRNSIFQNIMAFTSAIFEIKTLGLGIVKFFNISSYQILSTKRDRNDNFGSVNINSQNSNLNLEFVNLNFKNVQNGMSTAILSINPSQRQNSILLQHLQIINCFSFQNQIASIQFQAFNNQNQLIIQNITVIFDDFQWMMYLSKFGQLSQTEISQILLDNSLFNVVGGVISINQFFIQGIIFSPILKMINPIKLEIRHCYINEVQTYYPLELILLNHQQNSVVIFEKISIQHFSIKQLNYEYQQVEMTPDFRVIQCQLQKLSEKTIFNSKIDIIKNMQLLLNLSLNISHSLIQVLSQNSQLKLILNKVKLINNNCQNYTKGLINFVLSDFKFVRIDDFQCINNKIKEYGCLYFNSDMYNKQRKVMVYDSSFIQNYGSQGTAIQVENLNLLIRKSKIIGNNASKAGGGIYLNIEKNGFKIEQSILVSNQAKVGGGMFLEKYNNLNLENFQQSYLLFNFAENYANNLVEGPTHLSVFINQMEMQSQQQQLDNQTIFVSITQPYDIIEQGLIQKTQWLMIPSNQKINNYKIYIPKFQVFKSYLEVITINFKNGYNENLDNLTNPSCLIDTTIRYENKSIASEEKIHQTLIFDVDNKVFDLSSLSFTFDPYYQDNKILQIELNCIYELSEQPLRYYIYAKTLKCQLGEFYVDKGCQVCQSNQGFYSVTYNSTKCSIFDKDKFQNITSNKIQLYEGFWRPDYLSDYTESCFKNPKFCSGGWEVGNSLCSKGHIGGLCEECDNFDFRGEGMFFKNLQNFQCLGCNQIQDSILPFLLTSIWALFSILITLRSIEKSNRLFSQLKIRQKFSKIIFKLNQDHESILIKMLLNYLWIFSVIFTFNTNFSFSFNFIELTSNASFFMANNLDCYLSQLQNYELIYIRIIAMLILILIQLLIIWVGFTIYALCKKKSLNKSIISNTLLYLYVSNYAALIKQLCSIVSKREISNIFYIQGDVSLIYGTTTHFSWIIGFAIPSLGIIGLLIPFSLFFVMYINREQLDKIKLRRHICYLFNEYNTESYYWEQIKLSKKTIIIIILTYFESNVLLRASLLGLCLLFYQLLAVKQKPYIISSLNFLDIQTGQICSISIFIAAAKYVSEKENDQVLSVILQIFIVLLCCRLCYPFITNIFRVYFKKYKVPLIDYFHKLLRCIKANCFLTIYLNNQLKKLNYLEQRRRNNFAKLRCHLIQISKVQIGHQKQMISMINSQSTIRYRQTITDVEMNKLISP